MLKTAYLQIDKKQYPICLNNQALIKFEQITGINPLVPRKFSYADLLCLLYSGLYGGAKKEGIQFNMTLEETYELLDTHPEAFDKLADLMDAESTEKPEETKK